MRTFLTIATLVWLAPPSAVAQEKAKHVYQIQLWAGPNAKSDPRVVGIYNHHACDSKVAIVRVDRMPAPAKRQSPIGSELVVEIDKSGKIIRRWGMPVDAVVAAVVGDRVIVALSAAGKQALSVSSSGALALTPIPGPTSFIQQTQCPAIKAFGESAYVRCFEFQDLNSAEVRKIAYQGPCT
jgi:hypothetical protein